MLRVPRSAAFVALALLIALFGARLLHTAASKSFTIDEPAYVGKGLYLWRTGDYDFARSLHYHPPLAFHLGGLALLALDVGDAADRPGVCATLLKRGDPPVRRLRVLGRLPFVLLACWGALLCFLWAREVAGEWAGVLAAGLFTFSPSVLAHGSLAHSDITLSVLFLQALYTLWRSLQVPSVGRIVLCGLSLGLALAAKLTAILLFAIMPLLMLAAVLRPTQSPEGLPPPPDLGARLRRSALRGLVICALAVAVVWLSYGGSFAWIEVPEGRFAGTRVPAYLRSFFFVNAANASGRATYFLGEIGADGSPAFFPLAFTIKEPIAFLGLLLAAVISLGWRRGRLGLFVGIPSAVFGVILVAWLQVPMGYRYALPLLPLFCVFIATQLVPAAPRLPRGALVAACVVLFAEGAWIHPHYLAFFNGLAGGPAGGHRFLLESNLDWGQDVETLARYLEERGQPPVWLALFSAERLQQLGVSGRPVRGCKPVGGLLAISRNVRHGLYAPNHLLARATPGCFDWLDAHEPVAHLGYSILVYELPADAPPGGGTARR